MDDRQMASSLRRFTPAPFQPRLSRSERKATGVYYTPPEIVRLVVDLTLPRTDSAPIILDPACGAGEFLLEAYRRLAELHPADRLRPALTGLDIDQSAVTIARQRLQQMDCSFLASNIRVADALDQSTLPPNSCDLIIGNPPYVNIRQLAKSLPRAKIDRLRQDYHSARGNFDLYVLFIERAIQLLRPGGRCALVVPNKWATLDYARPCRDLLLSHTTIEHVIDLSTSRVFAGASVYPNVLIFCKQTSAKHHCVQFSEYPNLQPSAVPQPTLSPDSIYPRGTLHIESRVTTSPLGQIATLSCGTAGYTAPKVARRLFNASSAVNKNTADFITSGNIDRYAISVGSVRYLNRDYTRPRLPLAIPELTDAKRRLFAGQKIVIAGMSRRLEAAWDSRGLALGVQVFAACDFKLDSFYVLALLNSKLLSYLFATRYSAKRLGGSYFAINKGQLARLPIRRVTSPDRADTKVERRLSRLAASWSPDKDTEIDRLVYRLYRLTDDQIVEVERTFAVAAAQVA